MKSSIAAVFAVCLIFFSSFGARADTLGFVRGTVTNGGKAAAGVMLELSGEGSPHKTTSDAKGAFSFASVPFGHYQLSATLAGTPPFTEPVDIESGSVVTLAIELRLKEIAHAATAYVRGAGSQPVSVNSISSAQLAALPENSSLNEVVETLPGIARFSYNEPIAHGFHGVTYEIDGVPLVQATTANFSEIIDPRDVDSLEVFTGAFPAEFGGSRQGAVVNVISKRVNDLDQGEQGGFSVGAGSYGDLQTQLTENAKFGGTELFFNADLDRTDRGVDPPTFVPVHDDSNTSDQFLRMISNVGKRDTLTFDASNSSSNFQIPINDSFNLNDPIVVPSSTDDVQREYRKFFNLVYTDNAANGNAYTQIAPWYEDDRVVYAGDVAADLAGLTPALEQDRGSQFEGLRLVHFHIFGANAVKTGIDGSIENFSGTETIYYNTNPAGTQIPVQSLVDDSQKRGSQIGAYVEDKWTPTKYVSVQGGLRYDRSNGYVSGSQLSPRLEINGQVDPSDVLHFYYGRLYAAPFIEDTRRAATVLGGAPPGSVAPYNLQPEHDQYYEFGLEHALSSTTRSTLNFWKRDVLDVLDTQQLANTPIFAVYNSAIGIAKGVEGRVDSRFQNGDSLFFSASLSSSRAGGVSGSTFLFCPSLSPGCLSGLTSDTLSPEDHDQAFSSELGYTHRFGANHSFFATLEPQYGTGFPIAFDNGSTGRLLPHLTFDGSIGRDAKRGDHPALGFDFTFQNFTNDAYLLKVENGFNTTQWAQGFRADFRVTAPF